MKILTFRLLPLMLVLGLAHTANAVEPDDEQCVIDWSMRQDMFLWGSFHVKDKHSGEERGSFLVNYIPGAGNVVKDAATHWGHAAEALRPYVQGENFWHHQIWDSVTGGLKWGWDINAECGIGAIPKDFKYLWNDMNAVKVTEFGAVGHIALDCLGFVASGVCRPIVSVVGGVAGVVRAVVVPAFKLAAPACVALGEATVCGAGWPMLKMVWNGTAWVGTQVYAHTPPEKDSLIVTWVPAAANNGSCHLPKSEL